MNWIKEFFKPKVAFSNPDQRIKSPETQKVLDLVKDYFVSNGGLADVVKRFEEKGFVSKVRSWISNGANQPINSVETLQLIGWQSLSEISKKAGVPIDRLRDLLTELLPTAIDKATPEGKLPRGSSKA
jgi:uncharacterized protein YidB (DUF937 family)